MWLYLISFIEFCKTAFFVLGYISNNSLFPEPLSSEEEKECLEKYMNGDEEARKRIDRTKFTFGSTYM